MRVVKILFIGHLAALAFGLGGLLIALPHPELWSGSPFGQRIFQFGITYAGSLHILFGAATMLLFGLLFVGPKKTLIFFAASTLISLGMELLGTSTGFPFGAYSYTSFLGFKVAGLVPYSIPLSWFYMGFTSYILASAITSRLKGRQHTLWSLLLGAYFLTAWDLALDPAMASEHLPVHFWIWQEVGPYYGMPIRNLVGWTINGLIYMTVSRLFWRADLDTRRLAMWIPFGVYAANIAFAIGLNLNVGLWVPSLMAVIFGLLPASLALVAGRRSAGQRARVRLQGAGQRRPYTKGGVTRRGGGSIIRLMSLLTIRTGGRMIVKREMELAVEGLEHIPDSGPVLIAARHVHHLYDGCVLQQAVPRRVHILVALDWVKQRPLRFLMEWACRMVDWPVLLRAERLQEQDGATISAYAPQETRRYLRSAIKDAVRLLRDEEVLVMFPEGYPNIDPTYTPKSEDMPFLPFRPGFARLVQMAERDGQTEVAVVPAGLIYTPGQRWHVALRFGPAFYRLTFATAEQFTSAIEQQVRTLSQDMPASVSRGDMAPAPGPKDHDIAPVRDDHYTVTVSSRTAREDFSL
ncbi:MAG: carotenoid biosynthesis protein [Ktedonobacteraceae bacterium]|nr:carotenoid biosynthesis protein [Ktedonobacteraceae bacterium]